MLLGVGISVNIPTKSLGETMEALLDEEGDVVHTETSEPVVADA